MLAVERQKEILRLLADGLSLPQVAVELKVTHQVAKNYSVEIRDQLGADTIAQAVAMAIRRGIID